MTDADFMASSLIGDGIAICGIAPRRILSTIDEHPCFNCDERKVVRRFSGSGWYEDYFLCSGCGEDNGSGYRPFRRGWRKENIADAEKWLAGSVPREEYFRITGELIRGEMGWDE